MPTYDDPIFFEAYAQMDRSRYGLPAAGEWHQLQDVPGTNPMANRDFHTMYVGEIVDAYIIK